MKLVETVNKNRLTKDHQTIYKAMKQSKTREV